MIVGHIKGAFRSLITKMGIVLLAMAGTTAFVVYVAITFFEQTKANLDNLVDIRLPEISTSASILGDTKVLNTAVLTMLLAENTREVEASYASASAAIDRLENLSSLTNEADMIEVAQQLDLVRRRVAEMHGARLSTLRAGASLDMRTTRLREIAQNLSNKVGQQIGISEETLRISSDQTRKDVQDSITQLIERDVALMKLLYQARAQVNHLSGISLALTQTTDPDKVQDLQYMISGDLLLLFGTTQKIAAFQTDLVNIADLEAATALFKKISKMNAFMVTYEGPAIKAEQQRINDGLSSAVNVIHASVTKQGISTVRTSAASIQGLIDGAVATASLLRLTESTVERFVASGFNVAQATSRDELETRQNQLNRLRDDLEKLSFEISELDLTETAAVIGDLNTLMDIGHPDTGIASETDQLITTLAKAEAAGNVVRQIVETLLNTTLTVASNVIELSSLEAGDLKVKATSATTEMKTIAGVSAAMLIAAVTLTVVWILLPIRQITRTMHRLAAGKLYKVSGFEKTGGEIGAMAQALEIFRDSLVENQTRIAEKAARDAKDRKDKAQRAEDARLKKEREDAALRDAEETKRHEKARLEKEQNEARRVSEEIAKTLAEEQRVIVSNLAHGLKSLASGDLKIQIETPFAPAYEPLRLDFNQTVQRLSKVVSQIADSKTSINSSSTAIASRTDQLADRTQRAAETLAETATSLGAMTQQVQATSDRAEAALALVEGAREYSIKGRNIVSNTVEAMSGIEKLSKEVTQITTVIDEIAFQTNLLALNAGVEAARAGSAGRGFAVVASEVRDLAQRSSNAAGDINSLLADSTKKVEEGSRLVSNTRDALQDIDTAVGHLADEANEIANDSKSQAKRIADINGAVSELDQLTKQNATMSQETQRANQTMLTESSALADAVAGFSFDVTKVQTPRNSAA